MAKRIQGINQDVDPIDQPEGTYRDALNALLTKRKGAVCSEEGNELESNIATVSANLTSPVTVIGSASVYDGSTILFVADNAGNSEIGKYDGSIYSTVVSDASLGFDPNSVVEAVTVINNKDEVIVYWTDNTNPPRFYNVTDNPGITDISALRIFPTIDRAPYISLNDVVSGGSLLTGAYYFGIRLVAEDDSTTPFMNLTQPVYISSASGDGAPAGTSTSKSIVLDINNLDQNYDRYEIAVVRKENGGIADTKILEEQDISGETSRVVYNGGEQGLDASLEEIIINTAYYERARSIAEVDNTLYMGNVTRTPIVDYQKFANNIKVEAITKAIETDGTGIKGNENYSDPTISFFDKSFKRGEVYALYLSFVLEGGIESEAFHIPGRPPDTGETDADSSVISGAKKFQIYSDPGTNNMAYWENGLETYPDTDDWDIYDVDASGNPVDTASTLRNQKVRHHHFPDDTNFFDTTAPKRPVALGFKLKDVKIPSSIIDRVRGVKVYYAKRTGDNRRIIEQGITVPLTSNYISTSTGTKAFWIWEAADRSGSDFADTKCVMTNPFHTLRTQANLAGVTHMKFIARPQGDFSSVGGDADKIYADQHGSVDYLASPIFSKLKPGAITYLEKDSLIEATNQGFSYDIFNTRGEGGIAAELETGVDFSHVTSYDAGTNRSMGFIAEYHSYKTELFAPFDQQELVWTGVIETDLTKFDPTFGGSGTDETAQGTITIQSDADAETAIAAEGYIQVLETSGTGTSEVSITVGANSTQTNADLTEANTLQDIAIAIRDAINADANISAGWTASIDPADDTKVLVTSDNPGSGDNGTLISAGVVQDSGSFNISLEIADADGGVDGKIDVTFNADILSSTLVVSTPVADSALKDTIATDITNSLNNDATFSTHWTASVDTVPADPVITITANAVGSDYNAIVFIDTYGTGVAVSDSDITGGSSASETGASFLLESFGGDTYISRHGTRRTGPNVDKTGSFYVVSEYRHIVVDYVCESYDCIELRHEGSEGWEIYYPASTAEALLDIEQNFPEEGYNAMNYIGYAPDYSALANIKTTPPRNKVVDRVLRFPTRIIRSLQGDSNIGEDEGLRTFLENDYIDLSRKRGALTTLKVMDNVLIPHMERGMMRTKGREEMLVGDIRAFVGAGDIFAVNPDEIISTENGFAGLQDQRCSMVTPYGYFFVDRTAGQVFLVGEQPEIISDRGLERFFAEELAKVNEDDRLICTFDNEYDRIILTYKGLKADGSGAWTLSYYPQLKAWGSFHSYTPDYYFYDIDRFYSVKTDEIWKHNISTSPGSFYGVVQPTQYEFVENMSPAQSKTFINIEYIAEVEDSAENKYWDETFNTFRVFNDRQDSGDQTITYFTGANGNARNVEETWKINRFRDMLVAGTVDPNKPWQDQSRFTGKYLQVKLTFNNSANKFIYLYDARASARPSFR